MGGNVLSTVALDKPTLDYVEYIITLKSFCQLFKNENI